MPTGRSPIFAGLLSSGVFADAYVLICTVSAHLTKSLSWRCVESGDGYWRLLGAVAASLSALFARIIEGVAGRNSDIGGNLSVGLGLRRYCWEPVCLLLVANFIASR
ncbi:hypothetical protein KCP75_23630 [Salmonella enterica subsp. enterica]|nr:hypothetical protein KCP75_23630 [Salmonella enterica subsp. enterica]